MASWYPDNGVADPDAGVIARTEARLEARHYDDRSYSPQYEPISDYDRESWQRYLNARRVANEANMLTLARTVGVLRGATA